MCYRRGPVWGRKENVRFVIDLKQYNKSFYVMGIIEKSSSDWGPDSLPENLQGLKPHLGVPTCSAVDVHINKYTNHVHERAAPKTLVNAKSLIQKTVVKTRHCFVISYLFFMCIQETPSSWYDETIFFLIPVFPQKYYENTRLFVTLLSKVKNQIQSSIILFHE